MSYTVRFENAIFWLTLHGTVTQADLSSCMKTAAEFESARAVIPHRLVDFTAVTGIAVSFEDVSAFAHLRASRPFPNEVKSALVAANAIQFGFARMYQTLMSHSHTHVAIFATAAEAQRWLSRPEIEPPEIQWSPPANPTEASTGPASCT